MKDKIHMSSLLLFIITLGFFAGCLQSSFSAPQEVTPVPTTVASPTKIDSRTLFEEKCSICHSLDRITSQEKTGEGWNATVKRMQTNGAPINDEEAKIITDYLAGRYSIEAPKMLVSAPV